MLYSSHVLSSLRRQDPRNKYSFYSFTRRAYLQCFRCPSLSDFCNCIFLNFISQRDRKKRNFVSIPLLQLFTIYFLLPLCSTHNHITTMSSALKFHFLHFPIDGYFTSHNMCSYLSPGLIGWYSHDQCDHYWTLSLNSQSFCKPSPLYPQICKLGFGVIFCIFCLSLAFWLPMLKILCNFLQ